MWIGPTAMFKYGEIMFVLIRSICFSVFRYRELIKAMVAEEGLEPPTRGL